MKAIDIVIFGFIAISILIGYYSGLDGQIKRLGKGIKGALIAGAIVFVYGGPLMDYGFVKEWFGKLSDFFVSNKVSFLSSGLLFDVIRYAILYFVVLIVIKIAFEIVGSFFSTGRGGKSEDTAKNLAQSVNKLLGAVFAGAVSVGIVMLCVAAVVVLKNQDGLSMIQNSQSNIFLKYNIFRQLFGLG
ncbi:MAG: hypothetical protein FWD76_01300 [Firmicutes bacterium]|nr:hypothetical protein [Bacillota bacterium]